MKNTTLALSIATTLLIAAPAISRAAEGKGGFFVNGNIGQSNLDNNAYKDNETAYSINAGYRWVIAPAFALGVEGGYTDPGSYSLNTGAIPGFDPPLLDSKAKFDGWTLGVNAHLNLSDTWYLSGRTGLFSSNIKVDYLTAEASERLDDHSNDWYAGMGVGYDFSDRFGLGLNYDQYNVDKNIANFDTGIASVSGEVRF